MNSFQRSWRLFQESWSVLSHNKQLLVFPLISTIAVLVAMAIFIVPTIVILMASGAVDSLAGDQADTAVTITNLIMVFLFALVTSFVNTFFSAGLISQALAHFRGEPVSFGAGISVALSRISAILGFSAMAATVGTLASVMRGNSRGGANLLGSLMAGLTEAAWNIASFLAVPFIVAKGVGPVEALKQSALALKHTFGETIIGGGGMGLILGIPMVIVGFVGFGGGVMAMVNDMISLGIGLMVLTIAFWIVLGLITSALNDIYRAAVYLYVQDQEPNPAFNTEILQTAFHAK